MSGLKTEIINNVGIRKGDDSLCLDQYPDGSVRLICDEDFENFDGAILRFKNRAIINLSKKEMMFLISTYLKNENEWGSLAEEE